MKKKLIVCSTTSEQEIINAAKKYFISKNFEVQNVITENGEIGIQARKTSWVRKCSGTSYALQVVVKKQSENRYEITAGWGEWVSKGAVALVATFIAFGFLIIPTVIGMVNQKNLPEKCLDSIACEVIKQNTLCYVYNSAM